MDYIGQSNFLQALGWAVLNSLWQMALLWVVYQLFTGVFRKARPAHKSSLASVLLIAGFSWFVLTFISILISETSNDVLVAGGFVGIAGNQQLNDWLYQTLPIASIIYLILLAFPLVHYIRNYRFVQIIRNYGLIKADVDWRMFVRKVAAQLEIKRKVQIWVSDLVTSPVTIGYLTAISYKLTANYRCTTFFFFEDFNESIALITSFFFTDRFSNEISESGIEQISSCFNSFSMMVRLVSALA